MEDTRGRIFDIQRYSIHDGPGIRTIVFFKGCILRCRWCCNPESQSYDIETMNTPRGTRVVGEDVTVAEVMDTVRRDMVYYRRSGGGMTMSGGEALCQSGFAAALCRACRDEGIHTAVETTGCVPRQNIDAVLPYLDLVLMDIKHADPEKHRAFTGRSNDLILENARYIAEHAARLVIRVPTIPGFNDTPEEIRAIARIAASLPRVEELHLLPYHRLGQDKYAGLGRPYALDGVEPPAEAHMKHLLSVAEESGLRCRIGG